MGEVLPSSMRLMALAAKDAGISLTGTIGEMLELQKQGALVSSKVLPHFAKRMHEAATANGGLEKALNSNRVAMNQLLTSFQIAADAIFKGGWADGLTKIFKSTMVMLKENEKGFTTFGKVVGHVFKSVAKVIDYVIAPALHLLSGLLTQLGLDTSGHFLTNAAAAFITLAAGIKVASGAMKLFGITSALATWQLTGIVLAVAAVLAGIEDLYSFMEGRKSVIEMVTGTSFKQFKKDNPNLAMAMDATGHVFNSPLKQLQWGVDKAFGSGAPTKTTQVIQVNIDGEVAATAMSDTEGFRSAVDDRLGYLVSGTQ